MYTRVNCLSPPGTCDVMVALRYVMEALKKPPNNKMYLFFVMALNRYHARLQHMKQYCEYKMPQHLRLRVHRARRALTGAARGAIRRRDPAAWRHHCPSRSRRSPPCSQPSLATTTVTTATTTTTTATSSSTASSSGRIDPPSPRYVRTDM